MGSARKRRDAYQTGVDSGTHDRSWDWDVVPSRSWKAQDYGQDFQENHCGGGGRRRRPSVEAVYLFDQASVPSRYAYDWLGEDLGGYAVLGAILGMIYDFL